MNYSGDIKNAANSWLLQLWISNFFLNHKSNFFSLLSWLKPIVIHDQLFDFMYSLISIRQNYNFDMLAMIWHEIVCWFLKIYQDLKRFVAQEHRIAFVLTFSCAKQFYVPNMQEQSKVGKKSEISRQTFVIWWLNSRRYRSVWYLFSCNIKGVFEVENYDFWS